jgi:hypothetical protein
MVPAQATIGPDGRVQNTRNHVIYSTTAAGSANLQEDNFGNRTLKLNQTNKNSEKTPDHGIGIPAISRTVTQMISTNGEGGEGESPKCAMSSPSIRASRQAPRGSNSPIVRESMIKIDETTEEFGVNYQNSLEPVEDM